MELKKKKEEKTLLKEFILEFFRIEIYTQVLENASGIFLTIKSQKNITLEISIMAPSTQMPYTNRSKANRGQQTENLISHKRYL